MFAYLPWVIIMDIRSRKKDHVDLARGRDVEHSLSPGFSDVRFVHQPLPEMALSDVDTSCRMFGKQISAPLLILGMTGGYSEALSINSRLAAAAEKERLAFGLGSQRAMVEKPELAPTYKVRKVAPTIPLIGNIGGCQLKKYGVEKVREALDAIEADALAIHLNPLQEVCQPEGDHDFSGILSQIGIFSRDLGLPLIVKETGAGMSIEAASALRRAGVSMVDVSGAGGTSWSKIEYMRSKGAPVFEEWGNPTCISIVACSEIIKTIGSGGVRNGLDAAKAIALGASYAGAALPFLRASDPASAASSMKRDLKIAMLLTGSKDLWAFRRARLIITGKTAQEMERIGIDLHRYARR
jgi:isopentenyl-diphosphate delta-isomerase